MFGSVGADIKVATTREWVRAHFTHILTPPGSTNFITTWVVSKLWWFFGDNQGRGLCGPLCPPRFSKCFQKVIKIKRFFSKNLHFWNPCKISKKIANTKLPSESGKQKWPIVAKIKKARSLFFGFWQFENFRNNLFFWNGSSLKILKILKIFKTYKYNLVSLLSKLIGITLIYQFFSAETTQQKFEFFLKILIA